MQDPSDTPWSKESSPTHHASVFETRTSLIRVPKVVQTNDFLGISTRATPFFTFGLTLSAQQSGHPSVVHTDTGKVKNNGPETKPTYCERMRRLPLFSTFFRFTHLHERLCFDDSLEQGRNRARVPLPPLHLTRRSVLRQDVHQPIHLVHDNALYSRQHVISNGWPRLTDNSDDVIFVAVAQAHKSDPRGQEAGRRRRGQETCVDVS